MAIPKDYLERVYAGVLGKIIGVYLGRPFEGWSHDRILRELGPVRYYVHEQLGKPLVVTDDDISGTFTFVRALPDYGYSAKISAAQIGETWLNYIIENRTILWWGGFGNSTEHTAYIRLRQGIEAPRSGSIELNGPIVAEQIGAQIFIDSWAMVAPGDPELAFELAGKAASVSHDREAVLAAQFLAVMEAQAFVESDINKLLDLGLTFLPAYSLVAHLVNDLRAWHREDSDWKETRERIANVYGYDKYGGNCHIIPNFAVVLLSLLYSEDDFTNALMIANTSGWDTDCNSGNVGCLMGIKNGLGGISGPDWRGPVADRLLISSADGSRSITDAVHEAYEIVRIGSALQNAAPPNPPKDGARFHFELPGSVQGFEIDAAGAGSAHLSNVEGQSRLGTRSLALQFDGLSQGASVRFGTRTFMTPAEAQETHYTLMASPTLYPGQTVRAGVKAAADHSGSVVLGLYVSVYGRDDRIEIFRGPKAEIPPGGGTELAWKIEDFGGAPLASVGIELASESVVSGTIYLDYLDWTGVPDTRFRRVGEPDEASRMWFRAWVNTVDNAATRWQNAFHLSQSNGTGLFVIGGRDWRDYAVTATITPRLARSFGLAARVRGLRRYYGFLLTANRRAQIVRRFGQTTVLNETGFYWEFEHPYELKLEVFGTEITGSVEGKPILATTDPGTGIDAGGFGFICEEGLILSDELAVRPVYRGRSLQPQVA